MNVYFLGGGNMAAAIIAGLVHQGGYDITVIGRNPQKQAHLANTYGVATTDILPELHAEDVLILAIKPQDMAAATAHINTNGALVLSVAAGLNIATLSEMLHGHNRIIRIMPNTPCQVGMGMSGLYAPQHISAHDRDFAETLMRTTGEVQWVPSEDAIDGIIGICGSGPAYVFYLLHALQQAAEQQGFNPSDARRLSLATFKGAVALAEQSGTDFAQLQANVTSKGGTTYAAIQTFEANHLAEGLVSGVAACVARAQELAQELSGPKDGHAQ
ncbi:pyrroline-5-carboxylate reductase [Snodgrassella sp. CFCC 13594]|uniref:pyrroline-5-carboxylate reductase n=1 Tax=Snodgrassella sp. CFCC 13594 TaxID=1775559 RepID=UPI00082D4EB0|nr:pyrroline-5-carboxylate reductase [Snodgrassella sp. CFCC 13594]